MTVGSEYVVIGPMVLVLVLRPNFSVLVLSLDTCGLGLGLVSFGLGLGLGLEPCGLVNITVDKSLSFPPRQTQTDTGPRA